MGDFFGGHHSFHRVQAGDEFQGGVTSFATCGRDRAAQQKPLMRMPSSSCPLRAILTAMSMSAIGQNADIFILANIDPIRFPYIPATREAMMQPLHFRSDYAHTKEGLSELSRLILDIFKVDVSPLDRLGHDPSIVAFGWWHEENLVANVSLYERRLWLAGEEVVAFGVQSVAVRPEWRGKGLFRDLMRRALNHADARLSLVILATGAPSLYQAFGFRQLQEVKFSSGSVRQPAGAGFRQLSLDVDADIVLLSDLFSRRTPTSLLASACDHPALFMLKASLTPGIKLLHLPALDAVVAIKRDWRRMTLLDIVAPTIPPLAAIVRELDCRGERIDVHLTPDRLSWVPDEAQPVDNGYMVRGAFAPEGQAFMLSDMRI